MVIAHFEQATSCDKFTFVIIYIDLYLKFCAITFLLQLNDNNKDISKV